jgi:hypothetical protein
MKAVLDGVANARGAATTSSAVISFSLLILLLSSLDYESKSMTFLFPF